jgi:hypothetical protein
MPALFDTEVEKHIDMGAAAIEEYFKLEGRPLRGVAQVVMSG